MARPVARTSLRQRILFGLFGYAVLLTAAVFIHGMVVNEQAERLVWQSLLESELDHLQERRREDPGYQWANSRSMALYGDGDTGALPRELRPLEPGLHDDIPVEGRERVVLVRDVDGRRLFLVLDITAFEKREEDLALTVAGSAVTLIVLLGLAIAWGLNRLVRPLSTLAHDIGALQPDRTGQRLAVPDSATRELEVIANSLNGYLERNERFVERERAFIDTASHELRTPIAVIAGASELVLEQPSLSATARNQLARIHRTARDVEHLISLLLALAKDPARLEGNSELVALDQLVPEIVEDHRYLTAGKDLAIVVEPLPHCEIVAPLPIVQAAIGNLLRNAIENSDRGEIRIRLQADTTLVIQDPGHGMSPEEISAIYAQMARGGGRGGGGIGLDLISRLCEHLGWTLTLTSHQGQGTTTTLQFRRGA